jgi:hypothetical protein
MLGHDVAQNELASHVMTILKRKRDNSLAVKQGHTVIVGRLIQGPTIPYNMALAADLASCGKNREVELLIKEKLKERSIEKNNSSYLTRLC